MQTWTDRRILDLFGIEVPIVQAPMAGATSPEMVIAVCEAGGLGSLGCAMLDPGQLRTELGIIRQRTSRPINVNFFCHAVPAPDPEREAAWRARLQPYYAEFGLDAGNVPDGPLRSPFDDKLCDVAGAQYIHTELVVTDKTLNVYEGMRHEVFNEVDNERVITDVTRWLDAH